MSVKEILNKNTALYFLISIAVLLAIYYTSVVKILELWQDDGYSHGYLLFIVSTYIFYQQLHSQHFRINYQPSILGIIGLFIIACIWFAAKVILVVKIEQISLIFMLGTFVWAYLGFKQGKKYFFPIALLLFTVPLVELFNTFFQESTAVLSGIALSLTGVPAVVEGLLILVPAGTFQVDTSCSGVRVVNVGIVLGLLYAYQNRMGLKESIIFLLLTTAVSFFCNIIRVYIIVVVGNLTNMQHSLVNDHGHLGWIVFAIVISIYLFIVHKYWPASPSKNLASNEKMLIHGKYKAGYKAFAGVMMTLIGLAAPVTYYLQHTTSQKSSTTSLSVPEEVGNWRFDQTSKHVWKPAYPISSAGNITLHRAYQNNNNKIYIYMNLFASQSEKNEAININNKVYDGRTWSKVSSELKLVDLNADIRTEVEETVVRTSQNREMLVWRFYVTADHVTGNPYRTKLYNLLGVLQGKPSLLVCIIATDLNTSYDNARNNLDDFVLMLSPNILNKYK